jgi:hypothetical protein
VALPVLRTKVPVSTWTAARAGADPPMTQIAQSTQINNPAFAPL